MKQLLLPHLILLVVLAIAGCSSPSRDFFGQSGTSIEVDGWRYDVFVRRDVARPKAEVIRMGFDIRNNHRSHLPRMVEAAERVSGCRVPPDQPMDGDSGVLSLWLDCRGGRE